MWGIATNTAVAPEEWNPIVDTVKPDPESTERYDEFYRHYRGLYDSTQATAHFLAEQQRIAGL